MPNLQLYCSSPHPIARELKEALQKRFKDVLQSGEEASDPIFISSAVLDISVANLLSDEQLQKARPALQSMLINLKLVDVPSSIIIEECIDQESSPFGFAVKKRKVVLSTGSIEQEIESYIEALKGLPSNYDCIKYWHNEGEKFTRLAHLAKSILGVPATSACVERVFSQVTLHSSGHKGSTSESYIREKVLLTLAGDLIDL
uniref:HAT C-terminal dimerisation domain-containing protein n=1 Tax=Ditylenchus dipsaci TaxID=166011 RepID=A0A915EK93_9BILA